MKRFLTFLFISITLLSCQKLKYGNVIEKWYEPENTFYALLPMTISTGKSTSVIFIPYIIHDEEDWCIKVTGTGDDGDTITKTFYIPKSRYDSITIGQFICVDGDCDEDNNNTKTKQ